MNFISPGLAFTGRYVVLPASSQAAWTDLTEVTSSFGDSFEPYTPKDFERVELRCRPAEGSGIATVTLQFEVRTPPQAPPAPTATEAADGQWGPLVGRVSWESK